MTEINRIGEIKFKAETQGANASVTVADIKKLNNLKNDKIKVGQVLKIKKK